MFVLHDFACLFLCLCIKVHEWRKGAVFEVQDASPVAIISWRLGPGQLKLTNLAAKTMT